MKSIILKEKDGSAVIRNCPFLVYRPASEDDPQETCGQIVCEAGGGFVLGTEESITAVQTICFSCDIPKSLNFKYACLYLVPFRVFQDNHVQSYYGCRWYFRINPRKTPKNMDWCIGCRDWFPRPQRIQVPGLIRVSHKFHRIFLNPSEMMERLSPRLKEEKRYWYHRLRDFFYW